MATVKPLREVKDRAAIAATSSQTDDKLPSPQRNAVTMRSKLGSRAANRPVALDASFRGHDDPTKAAPGLDSHWNRRIARGGIVPDISIDLHDSNLATAHARLDGALEQAVAQKLKIVLLVTGKARAHDRASGEGRGAIAAVVRDWLAASRHARHISAVRNAHPRHGGAGALYIVLKS